MSMIYVVVNVFDQWEQTDEAYFTSRRKAQNYIDKQTDDDQREIREEKLQ